MTKHRSNDEEPPSTTSSIAVPLGAIGVALSSTTTVYTLLIKPYDNPYLNLIFLSGIAILATILALLVINLIIAKFSSMLASRINRAISFETIKRHVSWKRSFLVLLTMFVGNAAYGYWRLIIDKETNRKPVIETSPFSNASNLATPISVNAFSLDIRLEEKINQNARIFSVTQSFQLRDAVTPQSYFARPLDLRFLAYLPKSADRAVADSDTRVRVKRALLNLPEKAKETSLKRVGGEEVRFFDQP